MLQKSVGLLIVKCVCVINVNYLLYIHIFYSSRATFLT